MYDALRVFKQQIDDNVKFIQAMHKLALVMNEDVDTVTEKFKKTTDYVPHSWLILYNTAYDRARYGIKDPWFYGSEE